MFFLGLAGSFMPYLLLLGALFVLTLGVNLKPDAEILASEEKTIEYQDTKDQHLDNKARCYFYHQSDDQPISCSTLQKLQEFTTYQIRGKTPIYFVHQKYCFEIYHSFFGLSPPALIS